MGRVHLGIDSLTDENMRCVGSRVEVLGASSGADHNAVLVETITELTSNRGGRKGKLILPMSTETRSSVFIQTLTSLPRPLRKDVVIEVCGRKGSMDSDTVKAIRGARTMLGIGIALSTGGFEEAGLIEAMKDVNPEAVLIERELAGTMVRTRKRHLLLDIAESCSKRGARVAVRGEFCDADTQWLIDAGAELFVGRHYEAHINCAERPKAGACRSLERRARANDLDSVLVRCGVKRAMRIE